MTVQEIDFQDIPQLSFKDKAYQEGDAKYNGFFKYEANIESFGRAIKERNKFPTDRNLLVEVLHKQYEGTEFHKDVKDQIDALGDPKCFTITTAHQPVLLLGPLFVVYKILSALHLCQSLKKKYSTYSFVPIFISGGEDHDFEEVATVHLFNRDFSWKTYQEGSVGRMHTDDLRKVLDEVISLFGNSPYASELISFINKSFDNSETYAGFNIGLVNHLFSEMGLVVLNMDDARLKEKFLPLAEKEIDQRISATEVRKTQENLAQIGVSEQAHVRDINLFFIEKNARLRITEENDLYQIGTREYNRESLGELFKSNPGNVSPNVVTRPLYQELILPNLAYIGGGGEIAYWLERKSQFDVFGIPYPMLVRRNSALIIPARMKKNIERLKLTSRDFFFSCDEIIKLFLKNEADGDFNLIGEQAELTKFFEKLAEKAKQVDPSLEQFTLAEGAKQLKSLKSISERMTRATKQKKDVDVSRISKTKERLFPNGTLQERYDNFIPYYLRYGKKWFADLLEVMDPLNKNFLILEED